jgi:hypothetical protein
MGLEVLGSGSSSIGAHENELTVCERSSRSAESWDRALGRRATSCRRRRSQTRRRSVSHTRERTGMCVLRGGSGGDIGNRWPRPGHFDASHPIPSQRQSRVGSVEHCVRCPRRPTRVPVSRGPRIFGQTLPVALRVAEQPSFRTLKIAPLALRLPTDTRQYRHARIQTLQRSRKSRLSQGSGKLRRKSRTAYADGPPAGGTSTARPGRGRPGSARLRCPLERRPARGAGPPIHPRLLPPVPLPVRRRTR